MSGSEVRSCASTRMPLSTSRPAASASPVLGVMPTPTMTASASMRLPSASSTPFALAVGAGDLGDLDAAAQIHAVVAVQAGEDLGDLGAEHAQQRQFRGLQHRDLDAGRPGRRQRSPARSSRRRSTTTRDAAAKAALIRSLSPSRRR